MRLISSYSDVRLSCTLATYVTNQSRLINGKVEPVCETAVKYVQPFTSTSKNPGRLTTNGKHYHDRVSNLGLFLPLGLPQCCLKLSQINRPFSNYEKAKEEMKCKSVSFRHSDDEIEVLLQRTERFLSQMPKLESISVITAQTLALMNQWVVLISKSENDDINLSTQIRKNPKTFGLMVDKLITAFQSLCDENKANQLERQDQRSVLKSSLILYPLAIDAWIHCSRQCQCQHRNHDASFCVRKAEEWLWVMLRTGSLLDQTKVEKKKQQNKAENHHKYDTERLNSSIAMVIHALCKNKDDDSMERARKIMNHCIRDVYVSGSFEIDTPKKSILPNTTLFNSFLHVYSKMSDDSLEKSITLLKHMIQEWENAENDNIEPNHVSFNTVIHGFATSGNTAKVEEIVNLWKQKCDPNENVRHLSAKPDKTTFNILIDAYSKSSDPTTVRKAEELVLWMEGLWLEGQIDLKPDKVTFTSLIDTFARHGKAEKAELILRKMNELYETGDLEMNPDAYTFSSVIKGWTSRSSKDKKVLHHCLDIIRMMEERFKLGLMDNNQPLTVAYNTLINVIGQSKQKTRGTEALEVLERMKCLQKEHGAMAGPNIETYNEIISILGKVENFEDTERVYNEVLKEHSLSMNIITVNSYLDALSRNRKNCMPEVALKILSEVEDKSQNNYTHIQPNTRTYNIVMNVLSKSGPDWCEKAENLLDKLEKQMNTSLNPTILNPDIISYSTCINAWSKSRCHNKSERAYAILKRMEKAIELGKIESPPNIFPYNGVLNACAFTKGNIKNKKRAFAVAKTIFHDIINKGTNVQADEITYATMLKACTNLHGSESDRIHLMKPIVQSCCKHGFLGSLVKKELKYALSHSQLIELLGHENNFDPIWSRCVQNPVKIKKL